MKFVCDNCQAKYQIGDEKVAGKTVRMKCRRCGNEIRVHADGAAHHDGPATEIESLSTAGVQLVPPPAAPVHAPPQPPQRTVPGVAPPGHAPIPPGPAGHLPPSPHLPPPPGARPNLAPPQPPQRTAPGIAPPRASPTRPPAPLTPPGHPAPHPIGHAAPHAPRPVAPPAAAKPIPHAPAPAPRPVTAPRAPTPIARPVSRTTSSSTLPAVHAHADDAHAPEPSHDGAVSGPKPRAPAEPSQRRPSQIPPPPAADAAIRDWYVGIRGTPTGPIHGPEIRERAAAGDIDADSLVWREGQSEWRPLKTFPELVPLLSAPPAKRPSVLPPPPAKRPSVLPPPPPPPPASIPIALVTPLAPPAAPAPPPSAPAVPAPAPSAPIALVAALAAKPAPAPVAPPPAPPPSAPAAAEPAAVPAAAALVAPAPTPAPAPEPVHVLKDPFATPKPVGANGKTNGAIATAIKADEAVPSDAGAPPVVTEPARQATAISKGRTLAEADLDLVLGRAKRQMHPMAYAFMAAAAAFGAVAAWALFSRPAPAPIVIMQQAPAAPTGAVAATATANAEKGQAEAAEAASGTPQAPKLGGPLRPKGSASGTPSATAGTSAPLDVSGFQQNVPGPNPTAGTPLPGGGGGQLSQGEITAVVSSNQPLVKRKCWQPALDSRAGTGPATARVNGNLTIGASGAVESASASGAEKDFPGLSSCIASRMKNWKFPPSGGPTTVAVPFVFAGQ